MSSADAKIGESVDFDVMEDVKVGDITIIPRGSTAMGSVTNAKPKGRMGKAGKLDIVLDSIRLVSGDKIPLRATREGKGKGSTGTMTGAIVATAIFFPIAAPLFLFMKGKDITIPKGTEITAYVAGDISFDLKKLGVSTQTISQTFNSAGSAGNEGTEINVAVKSDPEGAEIMIDGMFVGNTPSTIKLKSGEHKISIKKRGFITWDRTMMLNTGSEITIKADLEKMEK
ncbi:MAG: PEGA domain-containing protein [Pyrinomonadaceae bacterium]|nr:PEGA domain-containing protein [Pyrinomonadaceae bacterium]